ncbi:hypothetical protein [Pseudomonas aeruginosa]|uniref:hypothetical protein n=1 Tax=Pseudomonas aeruginosa TaxID=287 RepID=UPI000F7DB4C7|nr:hypothetical protein [Pseudomonas aeruginosa]RTB44107.1 hypothetical protein EJ655_08190 [Pseudomonas aeruginosa]
MSPIWTPESLRALTYTEDQQSAIDQAVQDTTNSRNGFLTYTWSNDLVQTGHQTFAVFGAIAREVLGLQNKQDEHGTRFEYRPVVVNGRLLERSPDEGSVGILYLMRCTHLRGQPIVRNWRGVYLPSRWLWSKELAMDNQAVTDRLAEEILDGENVVTEKLPGWV